MPRLLELSAPTTAWPSELPEPLRTDLRCADHADGVARPRALTAGG